MDIPPLPIEDPHPQQLVKYWIIDGVLPFNSEFFRSSTHICPEVIIPVELREVVILPTLKTLKRIKVLFSRKDGTMPTSLRNLKDQVRGVNNDAMTQIPPNRP